MMKRNLPCTYLAWLSINVFWLQMLKQDFQKVMVLEDDVNFFRPGFRENLQMVLDDAQKYTPSWDLMLVRTTNSEPSANER